MLAIFDLDDTLTDGDSSSLWLQFMVQHDLAAADMLPREAELMAAYRRGELRMEDYMDFTLQPMQGRSVEEVAEWVERFIADSIAPIVFDQARDTLARYKAEGRTLLVISATGEHLVGPISRYLGADDFLAIQLATEAGCYTGHTHGVMTYQQGKVIRLQQWLQQHGQSLAGSHGYSDSINDVPLLQTVDVAYTVNADPKLAAVAAQQGWQPLFWSRQTQPAT
ncbi:HAD family phosphatase [Aquitalea sp. LB_tupeE]|uniref:HAD family hydrolase n=1 Tax=Aquitalea sp. LB_tupeE TaxID=2748078 RepID=UPI0021057A0F|nr:HAD family hydrolase [Aquitalea sp. LB_tupeE]